MHSEVLSSDHLVIRYVSSVQVSKQTLQFSEDYTEDVPRSSFWTLKSKVRIDCYLIFERVERRHLETARLKIIQNALIYIVGSF